jgi:hypothetical protein
MPNKFQVPQIRTQRKKTSLNRQVLVIVNNTRIVQLNVKNRKEIPL